MVLINCILTLESVVSLSTQKMITKKEGKKVEKIRANKIKLKIFNWVIVFITFNNPK